VMGGLRRRLVLLDEIHLHGEGVADWIEKKMTFVDQPCPKRGNGKVGSADGQVTLR
jgi:hypothetical protein